MALGGSTWVILTLASALFLTFQRLVQKKVLHKEHASEYLTTFSIVAWIFLLPFLPNLDFSLPLATWTLLIAKSILLSVSWLLITRAYKHMEVSTVEPLKNISPVFLLLAAMLILNEFPTKAQIFGIFLVVCGGYFIESIMHPKLMNNPFRLFKGKYAHFLIIAALISGISGVLDKFIMRETDAFTTTFFMFFFSSIILFVHQHVVYKGLRDVKKVIAKDGLLMAVIVMLTLASDWLYFYAVGLQDSYVSLIVPLRRMSSLFVILIGGEMFHEKKLIEKALSCIVMLVGMYFMVA